MKTMLNRAIKRAADNVEWVLVALAVFYIGVGCWNEFFTGPKGILTIHGRRHPTDRITVQQWLPPGKLDIATPRGSLSKVTLQAPGAPTLRVSTREAFADAAKAHGSFIAGLAESGYDHEVFYLTRHGDVWVQYVEPAAMPDLPGHLYGPVSSTLRHEGNLALSAEQARDEITLAVFTVVATAFALFLWAASSAFAALVIMGICAVVRAAVDNWRKVTPAAV